MLQHAIEQIKKEVEIGYVSQNFGKAIERILNAYDTHLTQSPKGDESAIDTDGT